MAIDRYNRRIDYLRISVTDRCNLGCVYCRPEKHSESLPGERLLRAEEIVRLVRIARQFEVRKVRLTGGEPLLRPDIAELVAGVKAIGVPDLSLTTNGLFLAEKAGALKQAGLDRVNVSLDSLKSDRYRRITNGGELRQVLDGIAMARQVGLGPIKINVVLLRGVNDDEILNFARLTYEDLEHPFHVRFIELMPTRRHRLKGQGHGVKTDEAMAVISTALGPLEQQEFRGQGPSRNYRLPGAPGVLGFISPMTHSFCDYCNRLRVNAMGVIRPCLFADTAIDIGTPLRQDASDEELSRLFARAIELKPRGNFLKGDQAFSLPAMASIGG